MGVDAVSVGQHAFGWSTDPNAGSDLASSRFPGGDQPALSRPVDRLDPAVYAGRASAGGRISLD